MKFNKFCLIKMVYIIGIGFMMLSCSFFKNIRDENDQNIDAGYFEHRKMSNDTRNIDYKTQLDMQNLQTVSTIYFPLNKYCILPDFFSILDMHANFLKNHPSYHVRIEGHTDERGTPEYNIALGERRAYSVKTYLQSKGVLSAQMQTISYGKEKPIFFAHTEEAYSKNRRVVLSY